MDIEIKEEKRHTFQRKLEIRSIDDTRPSMETRELWDFGGDGAGVMYVEYENKF